MDFERIPRASDIDFVTQYRKSRERYWKDRFFKEFESLKGEHFDSSYSYLTLTKESKWFVSIKISFTYSSKLSKKKVAHDIKPEEEVRISYVPSTEKIVGPWLHTVSLALREKDKDGMPKIEKW